MTTEPTCPRCGPFRTSLNPEAHHAAMVVGIARIMRLWHGKKEEMYETIWEHLGWHLDVLDAARQARYAADAREVFA